MITRDEGSISIGNQEITALYVLLKKSENSLDRNQLVLLNEFEKYLYSKLSIQRFENIEEEYDKTI